MSKEIITKMAPYIFVIFSVFVQFNLFVTPQELEVQRREIMESVSAKYAAREEVNILGSQLAGLGVKIDKIYDLLIGGK